MTTDMVLNFIALVAFGYGMLWLVALGYFMVAASDRFRAWCRIAGGVGGVAVFVWATHRLFLS